MDKPKSKPGLGRFLRFNLRTLLVLIALVAALTSFQMRVHRQKIAIQTIKDHGGKIGYDFQVDPQTGQFLQYPPEERHWLLRIIGSDYYRIPCRVELNHQHDAFLAIKFPPGRYVNESSKSFAALLTLRDVQHLDIRYTLIEDLSFLKQMKTLKTLDVSKSNVIDIEPLAQTPELTAFTVDGTVKDFTVLFKLKELKFLSMRWTQLETLDVLTNCNKLDTLIAPSKTIRDISGLKGKTGLRHLDLQFAPIEDLSVLKTLKNLRQIQISQTKVKDISPLENHTNLIRLDASGTLISDLSPLEKMSRLERLFLTGTQVSDLEPLRNLTRLKDVGVSSTQAMDGSVLTTLPNLERCFVNPEVAREIGDQIPLGRN